VEITAALLWNVWILYRSLIDVDIASNIDVPSLWILLSEQLFLGPPFPHCWASPFQTIRLHILLQVFLPIQQIPPSFILFLAKIFTCLPTLFVRRIRLVLEFLLVQYKECRLKSVINEDERAEKFV
jgi:hypothetical protein